MASLIKCDKCGAVDTDYKKFKHIRAYDNNSVSTYDGNKVIKYMDMCKECYNKVFKEEDNK